LNQRLTTEKLYYAISEVAAMFDVSTATLRFWESEFSQLKVRKGRRGERRFQKKDIAYISKIHNLLKHEGYTIAGAKKLLSKSNEQNYSNEELLQKLINLQQNLKKLRDRL